jgi:F-type H+-transporting ATPase subunit b
MLLLALAETSIQLVPDGTLLFHLVLVVVMVAVLNLTLLRPINRVLAEREQRSTGKLAEAERIAASASEKVRSLETGLREARLEAYRLAERQRAESLQERERLMAELKTELTSLVAEQTLEIENQQKYAQAVLMLESKRLAETIGSQILGRPVTT